MALFRHGIWEPGLQATLHEVVDGANRPLCLLPAEELERQGLLGRRADCLIRSGGAWLMGQPGGADFGFSCGGRVPAFQDGGEFCAGLARESWGIQAVRLRLLGAFAPRPENGRAFAAIYEATPATPLSERLRGRLATLEDLRLQLGRGAVFEPFFRLFLERTLADKKMEMP